MGLPVARAPFHHQWVVGNNNGSKKKKGKAGIRKKTSVDRGTPYNGCVGQPRDY